jgi:uncharacterized protein (TIGR03437 family)
MSFLRRTLQIGVSAALAALSVSGQTVTNLYLLPNLSSTSPVTTSFRTDPFTVLNSFTVQPGASFLLLHPNGQKLYSVARSGFETLWVLDAANPANVSKKQSLGQAEAALFSPTGTRLIVVAGSVHVFDTSNDTLLSSVATPGGTLTDAAVSLDGSRAFILAPQTNRLYAFDLNTNSFTGTPVTVPGQSTGVAVGPDGLVYVSTVNLVQIIDGRTMTVVKEIQLNATPTKLAFTPDGRFALAGNRTPVTGSSVLFFDLQNQRLEGSIPNINTIIDRIVFAAGNRFYAVSTQNASLYEITISPLNINPPSFSGLGQINNVTDIVVSHEVPNARFMFIATPGSIYRIDMTANPGLGAGQVAIPAQPGPLVYVAPQTTGTPTVLLTYNNTQTTTPGGTYRPIRARVTDSQGRPLFGVNVVFTSDNSAVQISGATATTNVLGYAEATVTAPATPGTFTITATAGPGPNAPTGTYILTSSTGSTGGGGATGKSLRIVSGHAQLVGEQFLLTEPLVVEVLDNTGKPVVGQTVTFTLANGFGTMATSTNTGVAIPNLTCSGNTCTATTDDKGRASVSFLASGVPPGSSFSQQTIAAATAEATVNFIITTYLTVLPGGTGQAPQPFVERIKPVERLLVGQTGTVLKEAVQIRIVAAAGVQVGQPIPNVALRAETENQDPLLGPTAVCEGDGNVALSDSTGLATCNLKIGGRLGVVPLKVNIGGAIGLGGTSILLEVRPGPPAALRIIQGNNQNGASGVRLPLAFVAEVTDSSGNTLPGQSVTWEVATPNSITLSNVVSVSDSNGRVSALGTLGTVPGTNAVRVRIGNIVQNFNFTVNIQITQLNLISGSNQTVLVNQAFQPLVVEVRDERNAPVAGQTVTWTLVSGSANLSSTSATTDSSGRATIGVTAGNQAGAVTIRANLGNLTQTFTLTVRPPGPVFNANGIVTTARNQPGVSPCGMATIFGSNIAPGVNGVLYASSYGIGGLPLTVNNVEVLFGTVQAPIFALTNSGGAESIVVQVPCEVAAPGRVAVTIRIPGATATVENVQVFRAAPGIFETVPGPGQRAYAAVIRPDGSYVTPANPASRGETVQVAVTGLGTVGMSVTNRVGLGNQTITTPIVVGVNDAGVRIVAAYYATSLIGVYWVAFEIPADATPGTYRNLAIAAESPTGELIFSNPTTIAAIQ